MKKVAIILSLIFLVASCTTINERYTGKRVRVEPEKYDEHYDYDPTPYYDRYRPYYYSPFFWMGFYWWDPYYFWHPFYSYGLYNYYYGYYPGYYYGWGYPSYYTYRYGKAVVTRSQLKKRVPRVIPKSVYKGTTRKIESTGRIRSTVSKSGVSSRSISSRSGSSTSSRGSSGKVKKK